MEFAAPLKQASLGRGSSPRRVFRARACQRAAPVRGMARRKAQTYGVRVRCRMRRAPLGAPHALKSQSSSACYLRRWVGGGPRFTLNVALIAMANGATDKL